MRYKDTAGDRSRAYNEWRPYLAKTVACFYYKLIYVITLWLNIKPSMNNVSRISFWSKAIFVVVFQKLSNR